MPSDRELIVGGPGDLAGAIPHLLGYHPGDVIVMAPLYEHGDAMRVGSIGVGALDPTDPTDPGLTTSLTVAHGLIRAAHASGGAAGTPAAWIVLLMADPEHPHDVYRAAATRALRDTLEHMLGGVATAYRVAAGRYRGLDCTHPDCCPPEGRPVGTDSPLVAAYAMDGVSPLPDRAAWIAQFLPTDDDDQINRVRDAAVHHAERLVAMRRDDPGQSLLMVDDAIRWAADPELADDRAGELVAMIGLQEVTVAIARRGLDGTPAERRQLMAGLLALARRAPWLTRARVFALYAVTAYASGNGGLALMACEAAAETGQAEPLVTVIHAAVTHHLPPSAILPVLADAVGAS